MIELETAEKVETTEPDRIPIFSIDGKQYTMPAVVKPYVGIRYLWMLRQDGAEFAAAWLLEQVLGVEGFKALANYEQLTDAQYNQIASIIRDHTMGTLEGSGKDPSSGNGQRK